MREIKVKLVGKDSFNRQVYKNVDTKKYYKDPNSLNYPGLHTCDGFDGEPDCPLRKDLIINIVK